jgi:hypothetical protein
MRGQSVCRAQQSTAHFQWEAGADPVRVHGCSGSDAEVRAVLGGLRRLHRTDFGSRL